MSLNQTNINQGSGHSQALQSEEFTLRKLFLIQELLYPAERCTWLMKHDMETLEVFKM